MTPWWIPQMNSYFMTLFHSTFYRSHWSHFSERISKILKNQEEKFLGFRHPLEKNWKIEKNWFCQRKSNFSHLNLISTCSKLFFEVHNIGFSQKFQIFTFLPMNFSLIINLIHWPLAAKVVIKINIFGINWQLKTKIFICDQVLPSTWHFSCIFKA